jgi:hypothetical protein
MTKSVTTHIYVILVVFIIFTVLYSSSKVYALYEVNETKYMPSITVERRPSEPSPDSNTTIFVHIVDRYGKKLNTTLIYSTDDWKSSNRKEMTLINGIPSNGSYLGIIPATHAKVQYKIHVKDDLNYSNTYEENCITIVIVIQLNPTTN